MKQIRKRLTYANVVSSLALFFVLTGATAFAATKIGANEIKANSIKTGKIVKEAVTTAKLKNNAVNTAKIANDAVTGAKANESTFGQVPSAKTAETATNATNANFATNAGTAAPRAYARVLNGNGGGGVDEARSKGITDASVTFSGTSVYCFDLGFTPLNVQATVDWIGGGANTFAQATLEEFGSCPAGTDASVRTTDDAGVGIDNINFYVSFVG